MDGKAWDFLRSLWQRATILPGLHIGPARPLFATEAAPAGSLATGEVKRLSAADLAIHARRCGRTTSCLRWRAVVRPAVAGDRRQPLAGLLLAAGFRAVRPLPRAHRVAPSYRYLLGADTLCADGPAGGIVEWRLASTG